MTDLRTRIGEWLCRLLGHRWSYGQWYKSVGGGPLMWVQEKSCWRCHACSEQVVYSRSRPLDVIAKGASASNK